MVPEVFRPERESFGSEDWGFLTVLAIQNGCENMPLHGHDNFLAFLRRLDEQKSSVTCFFFGRIWVPREAVAIRRHFRTSICESEVARFLGKSQFVRRACWMHAHIGGDRILINKFDLAVYHETRTL